MDTSKAADDGDVLRALRFVQDSFAGWHKQGWVGRDEYDGIDARYQEMLRCAGTGQPLADPLTLAPPDDCWSCKRPVGAAYFCGECGAPARTESVDRLRYLVCLCHEINKLEKAGRLDLSAAHGCMADANGRIAALRRLLNQQRLPSALPVGAALPAPAAQGAKDPPADGPLPARPPGPPRRNLLEILLDPRTIQWLLASGGAALVLGLVIWLAAAGYFENPLFVAVLLGVGNGLLLAGGWAVIRFTRFQTAGRAVTLLACLVMPLNLWFYDAQGLMPLKEGGHLWVAALVCCLLYAASVSLLRDPMLVFVFVGGVALTGLLLLADHSVGLFWYASAPAAFLTGLGLACIHVERAFPEGEGPFSRKRFGLAFFWSGHAALGAGLLVVLGAQLTDALLLHSTSFNPFYHDTLLFMDRPELAADLGGRLLALALVAAGVYAYVYSDVVVRKVGVYIHLAVAGFLWAEVLLLNLAFQAWPDLPPVETIIGALAATGLLANFALTALVPLGSALRRTGPALALGLCVLPLLMGMALHFRAAAMHDYQLGWAYVAALAATAVACRVSAILHRADRPSLGTVYLFGSAGAVLLGAAGLLLVLDPTLGWEWQAPVLMLIPLAYLGAARLYRGRPQETAVVWAAHAGTVVMLVSCLGTAFQGFALQQGQTLNLLLAAFFAEAAVFYLLAAVWRDREFAVYACAATAAAAVWQLLKYAQFTDEYYIAAFALLGLLLLLAYRFAVLERAPGRGLARAAFQSANALLSLAAVAGALRTLIDLAGKPSDLGLLVGMQTVLAAATLAGLCLVRQPGWRRWYVLATLGNAALTVLVLILRIPLTNWQKLELVCVALGVLLLVVSHLGWYREQERENDLVTFGFFLGCLLVGAPLAVSVLYFRFGNPTFELFHMLNEIGMLAAGLILLAAGNALHIKSTTMTGAALMALYLLSLVAFIQLPDMLKQTAVYLMVGGGLFFGTGLLLSIYRDRLLALPSKIKRREGVFRVLSWR